MVHASLFSGIGGPEVAAEMMGWRNAFHCEINPFGRAVLDYWFPDSKSYEDITKTDFREWRGKIDVLTGGFPCQPFSFAGKRGGDSDERYLWPEAFRVIAEVRPTWFVGENVAGIATMVEAGVLTPMGWEGSLFKEVDGVHRYEYRGTFTLQRICQDLEKIGYSVQPVLIPAAACGAPHRRDRIFIIAHNDANHERQRPIQPKRERGARFGERLSPRGGRGYVQERTIIADSEVRGSAENALGDGCCQREYAEQGNQRDERDSRPGDDERIRAAARVPRAAASNAECRGSGEIPPQVHAGVADGDIALCNGCKRDVAHTFRKRLATAIQRGCNGSEEWDGNGRSVKFDSDDSWVKGTWWDNFPTVSPVHRGNDGLPFDVDNLTISFSKWRTESLKAYGNAIVPQVMYRIFQAIEKAQ